MSSSTSAARMSPSAAAPLTIERVHQNPVNARVENLALERELGADHAVAPISGRARPAPNQARAAAAQPPAQALAQAMDRMAALDPLGRQGFILGALDPQERWAIVQLPQELAIQIPEAWGDLEQIPVVAERRQQLSAAHPQDGAAQTALRVDQKLAAEFDALHWQGLGLATDLIPRPTTLAGRALCMQHTLDVSLIGMMKSLLRSTPGLGERMRGSAPDLVQTLEQDFVSMEDFGFTMVAALRSIPQALENISEQAQTASQIRAWLNDHAQDLAEVRAESASRFTRNFRGGYDYYWDMGPGEDSPQFYESYFVRLEHAPFVLDLRGTPIPAVPPEFSCLGPYRRLPHIEEGSEIWLYPQDELEGRRSSGPDTRFSRDPITWEMENRGPNPSFWNRSLRLLYRSSEHPVAILADWSKHVWVPAALTGGVPAGQESSSPLFAGKAIAERLARNPHERSAIGREAIIRALKHDWQVLRHLSTEQRRDHQYIYIAAEKDVRAMQYALTWHWHEGSGRAALRKDGLLLQHAPEEIRNKKDFVVTAIQNNPASLQFASERLRNDPSVVREAWLKDGSAWRWAGSRLLADPVLRDQVEHPPANKCVIL
jgi:hypothetical protein